MAIRGFSRTDFELQLQKTLSPTTPIRSSEHLRGRERKLEDIRRALVQPGRSIFVHGDRGVGKTSLAQTAAFEHQSASSSPIMIGCDATSTFGRIAQQITTKLLKLDATLIKASTSTKAGISKAPISIEHQQSTDNGPVPLPHSVDEAISMMEQGAKQHSAQPVI
ncbi:MAG: ATP-binding protein, partial [Rhizobiales bacterium]|nr:ATP-binding protein [Hyphomicrobiales bacterium]